jgi:uncharacterized protein YjdB
MATKKVGWNAATRTATVLLIATALPAGSVEAGQYTHPDPTDELGKTAHSHVTYQHVRDILYRFAKVENMQNVLIVDNTIVKATSLTVAPPNLTLAVRGKGTLVPTVNPAGTDNKAVTYQSDNVMVASVDEKGVVTGESVGETNISVRTVDGSQLLKTVAINVALNYVALDAIALAPATVTLSLAGVKTAQLTVTPTPTSASNADIATWVSSDPTKATVTADGFVTGIAVGTSTITATSEDGAKTATRLITVNA